MEEIDEQDSPAWGEEADQHLADDAVPLCSGCLEPCHPLSYYCTNCGCNEPVNPLASYMPYVDLRLRFGMIGKLWRKTWFQTMSIVERAFDIAVLIVCMQAFFVLGLLFLACEKAHAEEYGISTRSN